MATSKTKPFNRHEISAATAGQSSRPFPRRLTAVAFVLAVSGMAWQYSHRSPIDPRSATLPATTTPQATGFRIDVNTATPAELDLLPKVGPSLSQAVVDHRANEGTFDQIDGLESVHGIGPKTVFRIGPFVVVGPLDDVAE